MKARREHRVPLCGLALEILDAARTLGDGGSPIVFLTERANPLDEKRMCQRLAKQQIAAVPHGYRSLFRNWAAEEIDHPREVIEAAYRRTDLFERRCVLMEQWAEFLGASRKPTSADPTAFG